MGREVGREVGWDEEVGPDVRKEEGKDVSWKSDRGCGNNVANGDTVGNNVGSSDGTTDDSKKSNGTEGDTVGNTVGTTDGTPDGDTVGNTVGTIDGTPDGDTVGNTVGTIDGTPDGDTVGNTVGTSDGTEEGSIDGDAHGNGVSETWGTMSHTALGNSELRSVVIRPVNTAVRKLWLIAVELPLSIENVYFTTIPLTSPESFPLRTPKILKSEKSFIHWVTTDICTENLMELLNDLLNPSFNDTPFIVCSKINNQTVRVSVAQFKRR